MPIVHPAEIWQETGRWYDIGPEMVRLKDRADRDFVLAMTHEEISHRPCPARDPLLPPVAVHGLPDSDQGPRRAPAARRAHPSARVPDEGRLQLPHGRGQPGRLSTPRCTRPTQHLPPHRPERGCRGGRHGHDGRHRVARVHARLRQPARTRSWSARGCGYPPTWSGPSLSSRSPWPCDRSAGGAGEHAGS